MNWKEFAFFFVLAFIWLFSQDPTSSHLWFSLFVAIPLSPLLAMVAYAVHGAIGKVLNLLRKSKPKDGWWKDTGGY